MGESIAAAVVSGDPNLRPEYAISFLPLAYFCNSLYVRESRPNNLLFIQLKCLTIPIEPKHNFRKTHVKVNLSINVTDSNNNNN